MCSRLTPLTSSCPPRRYGHIDFCSSLRRGNVMAFQFHPERSGTARLADLPEPRGHDREADGLTQESAHAA